MMKIRDRATYVLATAALLRADLADQARQAKTMNAVDELRSYEQLAQSHVEELRRLINAFEALCVIMSDDQRTFANAIVQTVPRS